VSNRNIQVMTVLAGAAVLAGLGYALAHRSRGTLAKGISARETRSEMAARVLANLPGFNETQPRAGTQLTPTPAVAYAPKMQVAAERVSSAHDALDIALSLESVFDGESESGAALTARPNDHVPAARAGDDEDAPSPDDLAQKWITQATESERSLGTAATIPDLDQVAQALDVADADGTGLDDDETTAEYVRRHRISSFGVTADAEQKKV